MSTTRGVMYVHSAPAALCPHLEWAARGAFGVPVNLRWSPQPVEPGSLRTEYAWTGRAGTAAQLASALKGWQRVRFEVTEHATADSEGVRYSYTPALGVFCGVMGQHGDLLVPEDRLRHALRSTAGGPRLAAALDELLGRPWDDELEAFRQAGADVAPVRWLHQVV